MRPMRPSSAPRGQDLVQRRACRARVAGPQVGDPAPGHRVPQRHHGIRPGRPLVVEKRPPAVPQVLLHRRGRPLIAKPGALATPAEPESMPQEVQAGRCQAPGDRPAREIHAPCLRGILGKMDRHAVGQGRRLGRTDPAVRERGTRVVKQPGTLHHYPMHGLDLLTPSVPVRPLKRNRP